MANAFVGAGIAFTNTRQLAQMSALFWIGVGDRAVERAETLYAEYHAHPAPQGDEAEIRRLRLVVEMAEARLEVHAATLKAEHFGRLFATMTDRLGVKVAEATRPE